MTAKSWSAANPIATLSHHLTRLVHGRLWAQVLLGMALGIGVGVAIGPTTGWLEPKTAAAVGNWLALPGQLFLSLIQIIVIPLVFASVVRGISSGNNIDQLRRMGVGVLFYFVATSTIAIVIGIGIAGLIKPGKYIDATQFKLAAAPAAKTAEAAVPSAAEVPGKIMTLLPSNPFTSLVEGQMLQIVLLAILMGVALVMMKPAQSKPLGDLMASLQSVCMTIVGWAMYLAPFAVFGLMAQVTTKIGLQALIGMGIYVGTVLLGLLCLFAVYLILVFVFTREGPLSFLRHTRDVLLLAFSTSSSASVMPLSIQTAEEKLKVDRSVSQFVIPFGATINMDGTALYQGVATMFLAQVFGIDLGISVLLLVIVTAVGASIGSPGTPGVGIVILGTVLASAGIPPAGIALIMGVDRILDMSRTAVNVSGDLVAAKIINRWMQGGRKR